MSVLLGNTWRISVLGVVLSLVVLPSGAGDQAPKQSTRHVPVVEDLVQLLQARPDLRAALEGWPSVRGRGSATGRHSLRDRR